MHEYTENIRARDPFMIWSTELPGSGYCIILTASESGKIHGPWSKQDVIFRNDGGHGMLFETFDGQLLLALHQPNDRALRNERLHLFEVADKGDTLSVVGEVKA